MDLHRIEDIMMKAKILRQDLADEVQKQHLKIKNKEGSKTQISTRTNKNYAWHIDYEALTNIIYFNNKF